VPDQVARINTEALLMALGETEMLKSMYPVPRFAGTFIVLDELPTATERPEYPAKLGVAVTESTSVGSWFWNETRMMKFIPAT
jgi:hypothetical protein